MILTNVIKTAGKKKYYDALIYKSRNKKNYTENYKKNK